MSLRWNGSKTEGRSADRVGPVEEMAVKESFGKFWSAGSVPTLLLRSKIPSGLL